MNLAQRIQRARDGDTITLIIPGSPVRRVLTVSPALRALFAR